MSKRVSSKYKISRRLGESLWGRGKDPVNRRSYGPGQHGAGRRKKLSDFGIQLREKQKLKGYYGNLTEKQFRKIYGEAIRIKGDTSENLVGLLERRLDAVVYRMCVVPTVYAARQFINHGHVKVNGKKVNIPSYRLNEGDVVEVKEKSRQIPMVLEALQQPERDIPDYIEMDIKNFKATYLRVPKLMDIPYPVKMEPNLVIEYYSR
ncbi:MAG: 30S ribosomal protein S4 [Rickettsiales bacterium]|nr:30S ribosomal protein S4 [Rickettsiales bacterium]|tara:strand:+ start:275 stop:892 length:618 start_codon:yes stop_codon:yes gene_type:complete